jgi:hypothetical protein
LSARRSRGQPTELARAIDGRSAHGRSARRISVAGKGLRDPQVRWLFTPFDARAHFILGTDCGRHGGRLKNPRTLPHARAPSACGKLRGSLRLQGVRAQSVPRSRRAATRATAAPRPERTNKAFDFAAWKGGVACSEAVQTMGAWLARCGRVPVQRVARSHATVSVSPIREELGR